MAEFINSTAGQNFMAGLETAMFAIGQIALWLFNLFVAGWNWVTENINIVMTALTLLAAVALIAGVAMFVAGLMAGSTLGFADADTDRCNWNCAINRYSSKRYGDFDS